MLSIFGQIINYVNRDDGGEEFATLQVYISRDGEYVSSMQIMEDKISIVKCLAETKLHQFVQMMSKVEGDFVRNDGIATETWDCTKREKVA